MTAQRFSAFSKAQPPRWAFVLLSRGRQLRAVAIRRWRPWLSGAHGLNERVDARSFYLGRDYLFDLIKAYAG
jgi:hypothetical protein